VTESKSRVVAVLLSLNFYLLFIIYYLLRGMEGGVEIRYVMFVVEVEVDDMGFLRSGC
jgi:hypothetical protein